eukprot:scaffold59154_cov31-Tisochrysis_lutea.AAC.4
MRRSFCTRAQPRRTASQHTHAYHTQPEPCTVLLLAGENHHIINKAKPHMAKSGVALKDADRGKAAKEFRTSSQYFLPTTHDPVLERIDKRVSWLTRVPISHAEYIQVSLGASVCLSPPPSSPALQWAIPSSASVAARGRWEG